MKMCAKCQTEPRTSKSYCTQCRRAYNNEHYERNKTERRQAILNSNAARLYANRTKILEYLVTHPCVDCGEPDPVVLEFDHRGEKSETISVAMSRWKWERLASEIEKCDVRCANCHRRRTAISLGWYRATPA